MTTTANDQLVAGYLASLRAATADLPPTERDELMADITEHIATSVRELDEPNEAAVRTILDRLGDPQVIAAEARGQSSRPIAPDTTDRGPHATDRGSGATPPGPGGLEWGGVAMLGVGSYLLPVVGTIVGLIMISMSRWWSTRQKILAAVLSLAWAIVLPLAGFGLLAVSRSDRPDPADPAVHSVPAQPEPEPTRS